MKIPKFYTKYTYDSSSFKGEENSGEYIIDDTGYQDQNQLINSMLYAGATLDQYRASQRFDTDEIELDGNDLPNNPVRSRFFDDIDAKQVYNYYASMFTKQSKGGQDDVNKDINDNRSDNRDDSAVRSDGKASSKNEPEIKPQVE